MKELDRRAFLRLMANSGFTVMAGGLGEQFPAKWISPVHAPDNTFKITKRLTYATTCRECPAGCGMHVFHVNGRAVKAEGNPDHPVSQGGLCARGQSVLQGLYDPSRITQPLRRTAPAGTFPDSGLAPANWKEAMMNIGDRLRAGGRAFVVSGLETGTLAAIMQQFSRAFNGRTYFFESFSHEPLRKVNALSCGRPVIPWYALDECRHIVSFGADFLESWVSNVQFTAMFSHMHGYNKGQPGRFTYVGPRLSMTAANADEFIQIPPGYEDRVARCLLKIMHERGWLENTSQEIASHVQRVNPAELPIKDGLQRLELLAEEFRRARVGVALPGDGQSNLRAAAGLARTVFLINYATGNIGRSVDFRRTHALSNLDFEQDLVAALDDLQPRDILFLHQTNPAFVRPWLTERIKEAGLVVSLSQLEDETAYLADWVLPVDNPLEAWGDFEPWSGINSFMQPVVQRLYDSKAAGDIFLSLADLARRPLVRAADGKTDNNFYSWLRADWHMTATGMTDIGFEEQQRILARGFSDRQISGPQPSISANLGDGAELLELQAPENENSAYLSLWPSIFFFDGRTANRSWLQENPDPMSYVAWQSWLDIHPDKAGMLQIGQGDRVKVSSPEAVVYLPARLTTEIHPQAVGLTLGQGHWAMGETAAFRGVNGFQFADRNGVSSALVRVNKAGKGDGLICLTASRDQYGRGLLRWEKTSKLNKRLSRSEPVDMPLPEGYDGYPDLYEGHRHAEHRWAMVIDLQRCIGCAACSVACYAENNIPVLGSAAVREGREMSWLKVVPYRHPAKENTIGFLPLPCQQCDQAPCESVCPVFAAVHTTEGLNAQIYNRCVGTRYCSNNCPYKVRHFNWYNISWHESLKWQLNPDVTVRCRGVMEKCTFCVQRIRRAEQKAKIEQRPVADGEVKPACVQSCPAGVFVFGDLLDENSEVHKVFSNDPRGYQLLHDLNTKPAILYLERIEKG